MKKINSLIPIIILAIAFCPSISFGQSEVENLSRQITEAISELILNEQISAEILNDLSKISALTLMNELQNFSGFSVPNIVGKLIIESHQINDSVSAPYYVYISENYNPTAPTPLIVWLHGGVSRKEFSDDFTEYFAEHFIKQRAEEEGWIILFPMGRLNLTWWDKDGMDNVNWQIRKLKQAYNINDNRIAMAGFSDGGSGAYHYAFLQPDDFAMFFPWSGRHDVGTQVGGIEVYLPNLRSSNLYAVNGGRDGLYPAAKLIPLMRYMMDEVGIDISFTVYDTAQHDWGYTVEESAFMVNRMRSVRRDTYPSKIYWECSDLEYGKNRWLEITELDTLSDKADWHREYNFKMTDDRITIGFMADQAWDGEGVRVESISKLDSSLALEMGLMAGDLVIAMDGYKIIEMRDIGVAKAKTKRGNPIILKVNRDGKIMELNAVIPEADEYDAFPHSLPSGAVEAIRVGNTFFIKSSRVSQLVIYLHPNMVKFDQPVKIVVNDKTVFYLPVKADSKLMLSEFQKNRDRSMLWMGKILVNIP